MRPDPGHAANGSVPGGFGSLSRDLKAISAWLRGHPRVGVTLVFAGLALLHLWSLMRVPPPFVDEAWNADKAWNLLLHGRQAGTLDASVFDRFDGRWTLFQLAPAIFQAIGLKFAGKPDIVAIRVVSMSFGLLLLGAIYSIGDSLGGRVLGATAIVLVGLSRSFLISAHWGRYDIFVAAIGFWAIATYLLNHPARFSLSVLSGLLVGLAFEIHPNGSIYVPAIGVLYLLDYGGRFWRQSHFWGFVVGGLVGLGFYVAIHILPYPQTYLAVNTIAYAATHTPPLFTFDLGIVRDGVLDVIKEIPEIYFAATPMIPVAIFFLHKRGTSEDRKLIAVSGCLLMGYALLTRNKIPYYGVLSMPSIDLVLASFVLMLHSISGRMHIGERALRILAFSLIVSNGALSFYLIKSNAYPDYQETQRQINQVISINDSIMGSQTFWFGLYDHTYYSWESLTYFQSYYPGSTVEQALEEFHPDIFIIDQHLDSYISDIPRASLYGGALRLPRREVEAILRERASLLLSYDSAYYGTVRVYRLRW